MKKCDHCKCKLPKCHLYTTGMHFCHVMCYLGFWVDYLTKGLSENNTVQSSKL